VSSLFLTSYHLFHGAALFCYLTFRFGAAVVVTLFAVYLRSNPTRGELFFSTLLKRSIDKFIVLGISCCVMSYEVAPLNCLLFHGSNLVPGQITL
jgi:hypothetical protein